MKNEHRDYWPFKESVDARDVPDYYEFIKDLMGEWAKSVIVFSLLDFI